MTDILRRLLAILIAGAIAATVYLTGRLAEYPDALLWAAIVFAIGLWAGWPSEPFDYLDYLRGLFRRKDKQDK